MSMEELEELFWALDTTRRNPRLKIVDEDLPGSLEAIVHKSGELGHFLPPLKSLSSRIPSACRPECTSLTRQEWSNPSTLIWIGNFYVATVRPPNIVVKVDSGIVPGKYGLAQSKNSLS
jgi:hypothetical protein